MKKFLLLLIIACSLNAEEAHEFYGRHLIASYSECDIEALSNIDNLRRAMGEAIKESGATVLDETHYVFPPNGLTMVFLLSESHASIHTYPEYGACFVDLFTCGSKCSAEKFDAVLRDYLKPQKVESRALIRNEGIQG